MPVCLYLPHTFFLRGDTVIAIFMYNYRIVIMLEDADYIVIILEDIDYLYFLR